MKPPIGQFLFSSAIILSAAAIGAATARADAVKLTVNTADDHDDGMCDGADCTLREAIRVANNDGEDDRIVFDLPAPHRITISSLLPVLTEDGTVIDGTTDPDFVAEPVVVLAGDLSVPIPVGIEIRAARCAVLGLSLVDFDDGGSGNGGAVFISGGRGNLIKSDYIGIAPGGANGRNTVGIRIASDEQTVTHNTISYNDWGIRVEQGVSRQTIQSNRIGTDPTGMTAAPNIIGILLDHDTSEVLIGGPGEGNLISGNAGTGLMAAGQGHILQGNLIGTDITGRTALPNYEGVDIGGPSDGFLIGGAGPGEGNTISGNLDFGVYVGGGSHIIRGNRIGTDSTGMRAVGNGDGLILSSYLSPSGGPNYESHDVVVGGVMGSGAENIISGNRSQGLSILTSRHIVQGNYVGTDAAGHAAVPNWTGISVAGTGTDNLIGGAGAGLGNVISGNARGIILYKDGNRVVGNRIGTDGNGESKIGNGIGVQVFGGGNFIGTGTPDAGNVISGNTVGVSVEQGDGNRVLGNRIGTNADGTRAIPNSVGVAVGLDYDVDPTNTIVGTGAGNWIERNLECGVLVAEGVHGVEISGNIIDNNGALPGGMCAGQGVLVAGTRLDTAGITITRNRIFRNGGLGIELVGSLANGSIGRPVVEGATGTSVEGTACPGCRVEVFLADVDPTGFGEGKTYLKSGTAAADGYFAIPLTGIHSCDAVTVTATDAAGNTSEFSNVYGAGLCLWVPPFVVLVGLPGLAVFGGLAAWFLGRRRGKRRIPLTAAGGVLGVGLGLLVLWMPVVKMAPPRPPAGAAGYEPLPPCGWVLDQMRTGPPDGTVFAAGTDVRIQADFGKTKPQGRFQWQLVVNGPSGTHVEKEFDDGLDIRLSELGLDPALTGTYGWKANLLTWDSGANRWTPFCGRRLESEFIIEPEPAFYVPDLMAKTHVEGGPAPNLEPIPTGPIAATLNVANCRSGPGTNYRILAVLPQDGAFAIDGRDSDGSWWWIRLPGNAGHCWVSGQNVTVAGETAGVPEVEGPPLGCWVNSGGVTSAGGKECVAPCPEGAKPGGVCEP
jgi:CSLREA domain-containing protein